MIFYELLIEDSPHVGVITHKFVSGFTIVFGFESWLASSVKPGTRGHAPQGADANQTHIDIRDTGR